MQIKKEEQCSLFAAGGRDVVCWSDASGVTF
jgi:hypothetical protein